ncbi:MFS transporter [Pelagicoccus sp. SDUM812003]|uniref:MFS transporter n=1 Tax=Pelagicoccus sp. SDUM812003 TaxID=3041267 RepID=UPI00280F34C5|nr:MFS transporter [Pelagicoccus sp. SDUM812003]MDQ8203196.1 MFS transporter [Pelagicoccus sp. SDUM812003]
MSTSHFTQKLSFREKVGYSLGDASANFVFQTMIFYQFTFYVDVFGMSAAAAGTMFLIGRLFDAITDPAMGIIADRTETRWGKFRPWLVWSAGPFAFAFWLAFTTPDWSDNWKTAYAFIMYFMLWGAYTVNNVPYSALNGVLTGDVNERTTLSTYRFVSAMAATFMVQGLTWPLVAKFGDGDDAKGWSATIAIFAAISVVFFIISFFSVKERVKPDPEQKSSVKTDLSDCFKNKAWVVLFIATLFIFINLATRGGALTLFTQYYVDQDELFAFITHFGVVVPEGQDMTLWQKWLDIFGYIINEGRTNVHNVGFGLFGMIGNAVTIIGVVLSKPLSTVFGKKAVFCGSMFATAVTTGWLFFLPAENITMQFLQGIAWSASYGPSIPLLWSMIADAADWSEWKTGRRATGIAYAGVVFALKAGLGIGGFVGSLILGFYGFQGGGEAASQDALLGIRVTAGMFPAVLFAVAGGIMLFYPISKELNLQIGDELAARRRERSGD